MFVLVDFLLYTLGKYCKLLRKGQLLSITNVSFGRESNNKVYPKDPRKIRAKDNKMAESRVTDVFEFYVDLAD